MSPAGRPTTAPTVIADCPRHDGPTLHAQHRGGYTSAGTPRLRLRCIPCHRTDSLAAYHRQRATAQNPTAGVPSTDHT